MFGSNSRNVLISSSRQWNPGDEFILMGVRRLLESILGSGLHYVLWNRNPDLFMNRWDYPVFRPFFLTNSAMEPTLDVMDLVVLAGTPEWTGGPVERVYRELLRYPEVPLLAIGVGGSGSELVLSEFERQVYLRENSLILCRNPMLAREVNEQLGIVKARVLPCPALFCSPETRPRPAASFAHTVKALGIQGDTVTNQSAPTSLTERLLKFMRDERVPGEARYVAHYIEEFLRFSRLVGKADIFYSYEPFDYLEFYRQGIRYVITSRLHGAIAALSCGTPAFLINFDNSRVNDAAIPFRGLLPNLELEELIARATCMTDEECGARSEEIMVFKQETYAAYRSILGTFLHHRTSRLAG